MFISDLRNWEEFLSLLVVFNYRKCLFIQNKLLALCTVPYGQLTMGVPEVLEQVHASRPYGKERKGFGTFSLKLRCCWEWSFLLVMWRVLWARELIPYNYSNYILILHIYQIGCIKPWKNINLIFYCCNIRDEFLIFQNDYWYDNNLILSVSLVFFSDHCQLHFSLHFQSQIIYNTSL